MGRSGFSRLGGRNRNVDMTLRLFSLLSSGDLGVPMLTVYAAQCRVIIERVALQFVEIMQMLSTDIDDIRAPRGDARICRGCTADKGQGVHRHVDNRADRVSRIRRT